MSDKNKPEELKALEPILDETLPTESPIASPSDQSAWNKTQEAHQLAEGDSATHIGLPPGEVQKLRAQGKAEKFELFDSTKESKLGPLENITIEGTVSDQFLKELRAGIKQIPENERRFLEKAGVKIVAKDIVNGHAGSPAIYDPGSKNVVVGAAGFLEGGDSGTQTNQLSFRLSARNPDITGSLKHEVGHAIFDSLKLEQMQELKNVIAEERLNVRNDDKNALSHLLEDDDELFAESYAFIRGRESLRVNALIMNFPKTIALIDDILRKNKELNS
ncbi:MAG: hypothetical protein SFY67_01435 [Candidatus Melainabacteria bacterium]|nr:hypothetical protein [Candidatus Melainabacteria bacterium]